MRGFYRISGSLLLSLSSGLLHAQALCEDLRADSRQYADELTGDDALHADAGEVDLQAYGISRLHQGVRLRYGRQMLRADDVEYDHAQRHLRVSGKTFFETDELQLTAASANILLEQDQASFKDARYVAYAAGARGSAGELAIGGRGQATLKQVRYTTCPASQEDWVLEGDEIRLDSDRGLGSARNARLRFKGVPLFWLPRFWFPVGEARRSGLLPPRLGDGDATGLDFSLPVYLNLAPNYDMTLTARHMARLGDQAVGELRYLWSHSQGRSQVEFLDEDERSGERRYLLSSELIGGTDRHWIWQAGFLQLSDNAYLSELGSSEADEAQSQLPRFASIGYYDHNLGLQASLSAHDYQSLLDTLSPEERPHRRAPELRLNWTPPRANGQFQPLLSAELVDFRHDETTEGWRGDARVGLAWRLDLPQAFFSARADYRHTAYRLREDAADDQRLDRGLPILQSGLGLRFLRLGDNGRHQTLSPQLSYLYVPYRDQDELPLFDTSQPDFSFDQLFASNRYTGADRVADANVLITALRTDWYRDHGRHRELSAKLGLQLRLEDSLVTLPGESPQAAGSSDWLGELDFAPDEHWRAQLIGQWNADENQMNQGSAAVRYQGNGGAFAQVSYRFRRNNFEQSDALLSLPLSAHWRMAGRWTYSLMDQRSLEAVGGVEYRSCCWAAQVGWRRHLNGNGDAFDSSIYLQLELNGLGRIGEGLDSLLERDIL